MIGRRALVGVCMLCALAFSAFAAQSALAVKGTTLYTCKKEGPGHSFTKAHCKSEDFSPGNGEYEHVSFAEGTTTEFTGTNAGTGSDTKTTILTKLKGTVAGVSVEIQAAEVHWLGWLTNARNAGTGEHYFHGRFQVIHKGATVTAPAEKGCKVKGGEIVSKELATTTEGKGDTVTISPAEGTEVESITLEGCSIAGLNKTFPLTGSINCPMDGSTITCTHADTTTQNTLKLAGQKAGIEGTVTIVGRDPTLKETIYTPLSPTTVDTP